MADSERLIEIELLGQEFKFYTAATEEEMRRILSLVKQLVETKPNRSAGTLPVSKVAVLACLNIASRYVRLEDEFDAFRRDSEKRLARLNDEIRARLINE